MSFSSKIINITVEGCAAPEEQALPCETAIPFISSFNPINGSLNGNNTFTNVNKEFSFSLDLPLNLTLGIAAENCAIV